MHQPRKLASALRLCNRKYWHSLAVEQTARPAAHQKYRASPSNYRVICFDSVGL